VERTILIEGRDVFDDERWYIRAKMASRRIGDENGSSIKQPG
jgi:hypothetical protein